MRQIKFRAWDKEAEAMHYSDAGSDEAIWQISYTGIEVLTMQVVDSCPGGLYHDQQNEYQKADVEIMQFTGLTDKNGKEIWEGDIVESDSGKKMAVVWDEQKVTYVTVWRESKYKLSNWNEEAIYIIGNIHEHPYLLKQPPPLTMPKQL